MSAYRLVATVVASGHIVVGDVVGLAVVAAGDRDRVPPLSHGADIDAAVQARMKRQEFLYDPSRHFRFLVTEAALRYLVCPPATLRAQLDRLVVLSGLDNVELAVLPFTARLPKSPGHSFWIHDDRLVLVETVSAELSLRDPEDIELYAGLFELFWEVSARGDDAIALVAELVQQRRPTEGPVTRGSMPS